IEDLGSKNGTAVNGQPVQGAELRDGDAISFGGLPGRFERLSAAEAATVEAERLARIETSARIRRRLRAEPEPADLLLRFLEAAMELTRTDRGFVILISPGGKLRAEVASGLSPEAVRDERFRGSVGAVRQAVESRGPIVLSDVRADPRLGKRPSVVSLGIAALACVPIRHEGNGLGGMGVVYKAHDEELGVDVALKVLRPDLGTDPEWIARFRRELVLAREITHKNVVRIHDIGESEGLRFLTMRLVEGRSLLDLL